MSYSISEKSTREREIKGLILAMNNLDVDNAILINNELEEEIKMGNKTISVVPLWKWLLKNQ